jgi:hypothetical protein
LASPQALAGSLKSCGMIGPRLCDFKGKGEMRKKELAKNWFLAASGPSYELPPGSLPPRRSKLPPEALLATIPPFNSISRRLLTKREALSELSKGLPKLLSMTFLESEIKRRMIYPTPRGRLIMIPIEEVENYNARSQLLYMDRYG